MITALIQPGSGSGSVLHTTPWWAITVDLCDMTVAFSMMSWSALCFPEGRKHHINTNYIFINIYF